VVYGKNSLLNGFLIRKFLVEVRSVTTRETMDESHKTFETCPECGSAVVNTNYGDVVCSQCGLVISENRIKPDEEHTERFFKVDNKTFSILATSAVPGTFVEPTFNNKRLAKTNVRALGSNSTLLRGMQLIEQVCELIGLSKNVEKRAEHLLVESFSEIKKHVKLTVASIAGAAVLFSVREEGLPVSFREIYSAIKTKGKRITASKMIRAYHELSSIVGYEPQRSTPEMFLERILNSLSWSVNISPNEKEKIFSEVKELAKKCLMVTPKEVLGGKNPYVLAAGALGYVIFKTGLKEKLSIKSLSDFAKKTNVTEFSLKEYSKLIERYVKFGH
jgi:transcription initiation factor TFIIB